MEVVDRIKSTLSEHPIVLFMKGTPQFPMCGFSSRTAQALKAVNADYFSVNVIEDPTILKVVGYDPSLMASYIPPGSITHSQAIAISAYIKTIK